MKERKKENVISQIGEMEKKRKDSECSFTEWEDDERKKTKRKLLNRVGR